MRNMRQKNIERAAEALFVSQGDDKNKLLASLIPDKEVRERVKDQGRALLILERLCLPQGKFAFTKEEIHGSLLRKLAKKGHRIQDNEELDDEQFAAEKETARIQRLAMVDNVLGKTLEDLETSCSCSEYENLVCDICQGTTGKDVPVQKDEFGNVIDIFGNVVEDLPEQLEEQIQEFGIQPTETDLESLSMSDITWQYIGQAYLDGLGVEDLPATARDAIGQAYINGLMQR
jgi:hypothetical protein